MAHLPFSAFTIFAVLVVLLASLAPPTIVVPSTSSGLVAVANASPIAQRGRQAPSRQRRPPPRGARGPGPSRGRGAGRGAGRGRGGGGGRGRGGAPPPPPPPPLDPVELEQAREQARQRAIDLALQRGIDPNNEGELATIIDELIEGVDAGFE